jgi:hypothetical protein
MATYLALAQVRDPNGRRLTRPRRPQGSCCRRPPHTGDDRADCGSDQCRMVTAIGVEHPLHHGFAPLVLEVDINVGRLAPFLRDKALEQEVVSVGIDAARRRQCSQQIAWE